MSKYSRKDAKAYARTHLRGIWAAAVTPFSESLALDEDGLRANIRHWTRDLGIDGLFIAGKQGEFFSMSLSERKRIFELAVDATPGGHYTIMSCSDQNMDTVIELARHAQECGADFIVVHAPVLHFHKAQDETVFAYYSAIAKAVDIGIALWSHPDSGYLLSPQLCNRLADIENVVAIKYSVPRPMYAELTRLASDRLIVRRSCTPPMSSTSWLLMKTQLSSSPVKCRTSPPR